VGRNNLKERGKKYREQASLPVDGAQLVVLILKEASAQIEGGREKESQREVGREGPGRENVIGTD
jgi:hypothetical protein